MPLVVLYNESRFSAFFFVFIVCFFMYSVLLLEVECGGRPTDLVTVALIS